MLLTTDELRSLTNRTQPAAHARVLARLGVPFHRHPFDGTLVVVRTAVERVLGASVTNNEQPEVFDVNLEAIRAHGSKAHTR